MYRPSIGPVSAIERAIVCMRMPGLADLRQPISRGFLHTATSGGAPGFFFTRPTRFARGKNESHPLLTRSKLVFLEQREVDRDRGRHPALAGTSASNGPQLAHAMVGRGTVAGDRAEDLKLGLVEGSAECRLQNHEPGAPGVDVAEGGAEHAMAG